MYTRAILAIGAAINELTSVHPASDGHGSLQRVMYRIPETQWTL